MFYFQTIEGALTHLGRIPEAVKSLGGFALEHRPRRDQYSWKCVNFVKTYNKLPWKSWSSRNQNSGKGEVYLAKEAAPVRLRTAS